ncbi:MAG: putative oxidoreductase YvaA [Verrucomicrobiota bacterium]
MGALGARVKAATGSGGKPMTAAIIGHSGRGNYGHGLEQVFSDRPGIEIVGLADADAVGRAKTQERVRARRVYSDYQEMLAKERPQLVSVAPRWTDQHYAMVSAALAVGAHVYCEKPFTRTLADADALLAVARKSGLKIAVAHQARLAPQTLLLKQKIADGLVGELLEIRVHGKQDKRAGGEDLLVLGTHQFDLVRFFAGDAHGCSARILQQDREVTLAEVREGTEDIGPIIGDEIEAQFALSHGVNVHYTSRAKNAAVAGPWGMEFVGTRGRVRLLNDVHTLVYVLQPGLTKHLGASQAWVPLASAPGGAVVAAGGMVTANRVVVDDWLAAIAADREPVCSGYAAMKSLEMIHAIFAAGLSRGRVELPLRNRQHPLSI